MISLPKVGTVPVGPQRRALVSREWEVVKYWLTDMTTRLQAEHTEPRGQTTGVQSRLIPELDVWPCSSGLLVLCGVPHP